MERILNQEEIDALFKRAQEQHPVTRPPKERVVSHCNFRQPGMTKDHVRSLNALHETFARNLTASLGAYLRVPFDVNLVAVEQVSYMEFLQRIPETTYLASVFLRPVNLISLLQLDLPLAFPIVDLLLGGRGSTLSAARDLTEIEEQILETVIRIMLRELQNTWETLQLEFELERRQQQSQVLHLMPPTDRLLSVTFEIRIHDVRGKMNIVVPTSVASSLLRKLSEQWSTQKSRGPSDMAVRLRQTVAQCPFQIELALPERPVPASLLLNLVPGTIIPLPVSIEDSGMVMAGEHGIFLADPIRHGKRRAAHVSGRIAHREAERTK
jgi:flagellar motor switch protein FliM